MKIRALYDVRVTVVALAGRDGWGPGGARYELHLFHNDLAQRVAHSALDEKERVLESLARMGARCGTTRTGEPLYYQLNERLNFRSFCGPRQEIFQPRNAYHRFDEPHAFYDQRYSDMLAAEGPRLHARWCNECRRMAGLKPVKGRAVSVLQILQEHEASRRVAAAHAALAYKST